MLHIQSARMSAAALVCSLALVFALNAAMPSPVQAQGGPVLILGIDPENGSPGSHGPISAYRGMINVLQSQVSNGNNGLLIIGSGKPAPAPPNLFNFWTAVANVAPALPRNHVNGPAIASVDFSTYSIICIASDDQNVNGGLTRAEWTALMTRKADLRKFINCGGAVFAMCAPDNYPDWYNYLTFPAAPLISYTTTIGGFSDVGLLPGASTVGQFGPFTNLLGSSTDIWHNTYTAYPAPLLPLARQIGTGRPTALGTTSLYVNNAPIASAGGDQTIECTSHSGMLVTLDGSASDADGDPITYEWWYNGNLIATTAQTTVTLSVGVHTFTLKASDNQCGTPGTDDVTITVQDTQPPTITGVGEDGTVECPADPYAAFSSPTAVDACDPNPSLVSADVVTALCGATYKVTRTWTATDASNNSYATSQTITVLDTQAPVISTNANATMWPPNHDYWTFDLNDMVSSITEACNTNIDAGDVTIDSVWSDEGENAYADGNTMNDIVIDCSRQSVMLRAERQGSGNGRVYTVRLQLSDGCNTGYAFFQVSVPHDEYGTAIDNGKAAGYAVTNCSSLARDIARNGALPEGLTLSQNFPNPFNPTTTISFTLPEASDVSLKVFDVNGREVARIASGSFSSGTHTIVFDATDLPSGMYMYRLEIPVTRHAADEINPLSRG